MAIGILIGGISWVNGSEMNTVMQQIVQYLGFVCASIFIVGGLILYKLDGGDKKDKNQLE